MSSSASLSRWSSCAARPAWRGVRSCSSTPRGSVRTPIWTASYLGSTGTPSSTWPPAEVGAITSTPAPAHQAESERRRLPTGLSPEDEAILVAERAETWQLLEERRLDPDRPAGQGYRR